MNRVLIGVLNFILIIGCSTKTEDKTLDPELFSKIYVELVLQSVKSADSDTLDQLQIVLDKFDVSREEFEATTSYFESNPELWLQVFTKVVKDLEEEAAKKSNAENTKKLEGG
jgi:BMFP domain-containing protein YqiC